MKSEEKVCPLGKLLPAYAERMCVTDRCAWWVCVNPNAADDDRKCACAVKVMSAALVKYMPEIVKSISEK